MNPFSECIAQTKRTYGGERNGYAKNNFRSKSGKMMVEFVEKEIKDARIT